MTPGPSDQAVTAPLALGTAGTPPRMSDDDLLRIRAVIERVVHARVRDPHDAEDAVQDALLRFLAAVEVTPNIEREEHYAATIAMNLVRARWRGSERAERLLPRLVDREQEPEPVERLLAEEEAVAVAAALSHLPPESRRSVVAHEVHGQTTGQIAGEAGSPGAVAASLARSRARLRVAYLLTFRGMSVSVECRAVLEAISAADRRRMERLDVDAHLATCDRCREMADVLARRARADLALLPLLAGGAGRMARATQSKLRSRGGQAGSAAAAAAVAVAMVVGAGSGATPPPIAGATVSEPASDAAPEPAPTSVTSPASVSVPQFSPAPATATGAAPPRSVVGHVERPSGPGRTGVQDTDDQPDPPSNGRPRELTVDLPMSAPVVKDELVVETPLVEPLKPTTCAVLDALTQTADGLTGCRVPDGDSDVPTAP